MTDTSSKEKPLKLFKCQYENCNWSFGSRYKLQRHIFVHTGEKSHVCKICSRKFARPENLVAHEKTHNNCIVCHYKDCTEMFVSQKELFFHINGKHKFPCKCPRKRCTKIFQTELELSEHLENHNLQYVCTHDGCMKRFPKPSLLLKHKLVHSDDKPYKCDQQTCEKSYATLQKLHRHQNIHENKKLFTCSFKECGKSFNLQQYLTAHRRTHEEYKSHKCPIENCCKHFVCSATLKVHLQKHSNIRPYKCDYTDCNKTYLTISNLKAHKKLHSTEKVTVSNKCIKNSQNVIPKSNVEVNEFISLPLDMIPSMNILSNEIMSREELVAATFGEFACNQYMNCDDNILTHTSTYVDDKYRNDTECNVNVLDDSDKEKLKDLQEEFVRNIYASSVNTDHSFLPSSYGELDHAYTASHIASSRSTVMTPMPDVAVEHKINNVETVMLEPSMELSTGHLEIDGGCFEAHSCMPDHIYSNQMYENSSTVNLQDIR